MNAPVSPALSPAVPAAPLSGEGVAFTLNGQSVQSRAGESIWAVAQRVGVEIPHLCHKPGLPSAGNCRACVVEVAGERVLAASCCRAPQAGMAVQTDSPRAQRAQRTVLELLNADVGDTTRLRHDSELALWSQRLGVSGERFAARGPSQAHAAAQGPDRRSPTAHREAETAKAHRG